MKKTLFSTILIALFIINQAKAQQPTTPVEMNNYLTGLVSGLYEIGTKWGTAHNEALKANDFSKLAAVRKELGEKLDAKLAELRTIKDVADSKDFRMAMLGFLKYEKKLLQEGFIPFESLGPNATQEEIDKAEKNLGALAALEEAELVKIRKTQADYASNNSFSIEDAKE